MNNSWLQYNTSSNRFKQTYLQGFLDVSGNTIIRNGSLSVKNGNVLIPHGDISMNGNIICSGSIELGATAGSGYKMVINGNTRVKNSILVDNDASVMSSLGVGKVANDSYPLDVSGATRLSSNLTVGGSATMGSMIAGSSRFNGNVGIGADVDPNYALYTNGQFRSTGLSTFDQAIAVGNSIDVEAGELQSSTLFVKVPITSTATNHVIMNVPNNLYTSTDDANRAQVNNLEIDTKNRVIKPYRNYEGALVNDATDGWDLGAPGAYSFDHVYGRSLEVSKNVGIGKSSDAAYAIDVSGSSRLSSDLSVGGAATLSSLENVTGTSKFSGHVGFGKVASGTHAVDISGSTRVSGVAFVDTSVVIGQSEPSTAALHVKVPYNLDVSNSVVFEVPNVIYKSTSSENPSQTNYLEIDTKTRSIKPYAKVGDTLLNSAETGWDLGGPGANRFNTIYGRDLQISTNTIKIEDDSGNQISMSFDAVTGSVNYTVTDPSNNSFVIKGVQTQKISSGPGKIDPSMLEFTGLSFGDTFVTNDVYSLDSAFTYNLGTTTYTGNETDFTTSSAAQSLNSFVTGTNLTTLLARITSGDSVVIKVGATDGRSAPLEGIDVEGSLVSLSNKIISVHKQGATIKWTLWNSDAYQSSAGNFLHYIELKNINMANGTYFIAKTAGTLTYNINNTQYLNSGDLTPENGDLYLYIERGPGNNWTKIPVSLPQAGTIQTQHLADSAVTTAKLANNSVTGDKLAGGSISGTKITDNSITGAKIADSNVTSAKIADGAITGAKLADGVISSATLIANGIITGAKLVAGSVTESALGDAAVVTAKLADFAVTTSKIADSAVTADKVLDGTLTSGKFASDSITSIAIVAGSVTNVKIADNSISTEKIMDGAVTASKLAAGVVTGNLLDASSVTMDKIASGAIVTEKIAGLSVTSVKIAALAVTSAKLADGSVTDAKLATDSVISEKISTGAITAAKLATNSVSEEKIVDGAVTGTKIASNSITSSHFNTASVTTAKIDTMAVTTAKINDYAVTTSKIGNLAVGTEQINDLAITSGKIAAGAITTVKIGDGAITTALLDISAVTTNNLADGSVTVNKIADGSITTAKIAAGVSLMGPTGATGPTGDTGIAGPTGPAGPAAAGGGGASVDASSNLIVNTMTVTNKSVADTIISGTAASDNFGAGVSMSRDGTVLVVRNKTSTNTLYIYRLNAVSKTWSIEATKTGYQYFAMSGDGLIIVTSDGSANTKKYTYSAGSWNSGTVIAGINGKHITMNNDGSKIVFCNNSNPPIKVYTVADGSIVEMGKATQAGLTAYYFRIDYNSVTPGALYSCQMSSDGNSLIASYYGGKYNTSVDGDYYNTGQNSGLVRIYKFVNGSWTFSDINGPPGTNYGRQACINNDGTKIAFSTGELNYGFYVKKQSIVIYKYINNVWTYSATINRDLLQKTYYFGSRLCISDDGTTLAVGCFANDYSSPMTTFDSDRIDKIGFTTEMYVYKLVNSEWDKYATYISNVYKDNLEYQASRFGQYISMDNTGTCLTVSEDNYYSQTLNNLGRFHIYNLSTYSTVSTNGGLIINNDLFAKRNIISNGVLSNDKVYTNNCSILDTLSIGAPPCYGSMLGNTSTTSKYALHIRNTFLTNTDGDFNWGERLNSKVRLEGGIYLYGSSAGAGTPVDPHGQILPDGSIIARNITANTITATNIVNSGITNVNAFNIVGTNTAIISNGVFAPSLVGPSSRTVALNTTILGTSGVPLFGYVPFGGNCYVSVSSDGNVMMTSSNSNLLVYRRNPTTFVWNTTPTTVATGYSVSTLYYMALSLDGNKMAASNGTDVKIYNWSGSAWVLQTQTITNLTGVAYNANFVKILKFNNDGSKLLLGSYNSASVCGVYVYDSTSGAQLLAINCGAKGIDPLRLRYTGEGFQVAFSGNGNTIVLGNPQDTNAVGAAIYVWDITYGSPATFTETIILPVHPITPGAGGENPGRPSTVNFDGTVLAYAAGGDNTASSRIVVCKRDSVGSAWTTTNSFFKAQIVLGVAVNELPYVLGTDGKLYLSQSGTTLFITMNYSNSPKTYVSYSKYINGVWSPFVTIYGSVSSDFGYQVTSDYNGDTILITEKTNSVTAHNGKVFIYNTGQLSSLPLNVTSKTIVFKTGSSETDRMSIDASGNIGIGTAAVSGTILNVSGNIAATGTITAGSDDRLKENEDLITNATDTIMKLRPEIYDKKPDFISSDTSKWFRESGLIAQEIWYAAPELRHLVQLGQDISGVIYETDNTKILTQSDISGVQICGELYEHPKEKISVDLSGNMTVCNEIVSENVSIMISKPNYIPIDPSKIIDIDLNDDIRNDPDYTALGWGVTPASVNYIGLIPYLVKSIQELNTKIIEQETTISELKSKM